nr:DNA repair protein RAD51 homolog 4 isoform X1 [Microcebus murinus]
MVPSPSAPPPPPAAGTPVLLQKGAQRGVWREPRGCPRGGQPRSLPAPSRPAGSMGVLRAGLCPGLTQDMVQLLGSRGIKTVVDLVSANLEEVAQKCGLSYKALVALRRVLLAQFSAFPFNGADLYEELKTSTAILSTGIGSLDKLLDTGLYTGEVTEIVGGPGSGKTQVCLCVAANVAHGLQQNVVYVDSSGGLTASRLLQLLQARTQDEEEQAGALQRIQVVHAFDIFQVLNVLQDLRGTLAQQVTSSSGTVKVVVVDSVAAVVSPLLGGQQREGDQSYDPRQGQREAETCPWALLELCAQHPDSARHHRGSRSIRKPAHCVSDQISPAADRSPGDGRHWDLGDSRAEPRVTGRSDVTAAVDWEAVLPGNAWCLLPPSTWDCRSSQAGQKRHLSVLSFTVWMLQAREDAAVGGPRNSCWCHVSFPCFYHVCFQGAPSSPWLGASVKKHASDRVDSTVCHHCVLCSILAQRPSQEASSLPWLLSFSLNLFLCFFFFLGLCFSVCKMGGHFSLSSIPEFLGGNNLINAKLLQLCSALKNIKRKFSEPQSHLIPPQKVFRFPLARPPRRYSCFPLVDLVSHTCMRHRD